MMLLCLLSPFVIVLQNLSEDFQNALVSTRDGGRVSLFGGSQSIQQHTPQSQLIRELGAMPALEPLDRTPDKFPSSF
jgi:hypothetical protein